MSYETNPIYNRIKINKGWKNPYLPTKTLKYSRDISLWFKVYLLLKVFLNLKKIQLISCQIRFDQQNKKILYLRINKRGAQKKKRKKKKTASNSILKKIKTPMLQNKNSTSIFLLYKNLSLLKKLSFWNKNITHKKILSKFWLTKPKTSTWLNALNKIMLSRQASTKTYNYLKKNKSFMPTKYLKFRFYTIKQKQILAILTRIKRKNLVLFAEFFELTQKKKTKTLQKIIENLQEKILKNKIQVQKLNAAYKFFLVNNENFFVKKKNYIYHNAVGHLQRHKLRLLWKILEKKFSSFDRTLFLKQELPMLLLEINKGLFKTYDQNCNFLKKNSLLKKILHLNFLVNYLLNRQLLRKNYFLFSYWNSKTQIHENMYLKQIAEKEHLFENIHLKSILESKLHQIKNKKVVKKNLGFNLFYQLSIWLWLRKKKTREKKRKVKLNIFSRLLLLENKRKKSKKKKIRHRKIKFKAKLRVFKKYNQFFYKKKFAEIKNKNLIFKPFAKINTYWKNNDVISYYQYRLPYRRMYFTFLKLVTNWKLKYLIQDFIQKYFALQVEAKIVNVLETYKNKNYFRLVFPLKKKKKQQFIQKTRWNIWNQKHVFLRTQLKFATTSKKQVNKNFVKKNNVKSLKKKRLVVLAEKKNLDWRIINYFRWVQSKKDFKRMFQYFIPTLIEFSRSLDPQLLANMIAKVVHKAKKQTWMLSTIRDILQLIELPKKVGYKIILTGRINSKKKSRLIYITQRQITLQVFRNNMNFAYSQAKARIGTFGVKIWVYYKKLKKNEKNYSLTSKYKI